MARAELLRVLMIPDLDRAERIGEFWSYPQTRAFADLLIDCEEDRTLRAVLVGMLRETERRGPSRTSALRRTPMPRAVEPCTPGCDEVTVTRSAGRRGDLSLRRY